MSEEIKQPAGKTEPVVVAEPVKVTKKVAADVYDNGFKIPLEIHPQHSKSDKITFYKGTSMYSLKPKDILMLGAGKIKPKESVGKIPWAAAIGLFVNNLDGGRNKAFSDMLEQKKQDTISDNLK